jgi:anthranilate synthase/aminodeoxychorismate synthase-like glutamine amidotransferase
MILLIDNYDSFVFNLAQAFRELGEEVIVRRNDRISLKEAKALSPNFLVISPGPKTPADAGLCNDLIKFFSEHIQVFGVCLGHQCIASVFGGKIKRAEKVMHGKLSLIYHDDKTIYEGVRNPFMATRYHSLVVEEESLPSCLEISSYTDEGEIMGIRLKGEKVEGVQFHPESFLTKEGTKILSNFLHLGGKK